MTITPIAPLEPDDETQTWRPRRGRLFRVLAWSLLVLILAGVAAMAALTFGPV